MAGGGWRVVGGGWRVVRRLRAALCHGRKHRPSRPHWKRHARAGHATHYTTTTTTTPFHPQPPAPTLASRVLCVRHRTDPHVQLGEFGVLALYGRRDLPLLCRMLLQQDGRQVRGPWSVVRGPWSVGVYWRCLPIASCCFVRVSSSCVDALNTLRSSKLPLPLAVSHCLPLHTARLSLLPNHHRTARSKRPPRVLALT